MGLAAFGSFRLDAGPHHHLRPPGPLVTPTFPPPPSPSLSLSLSASEEREREREGKGEGRRKVGLVEGESGSVRIPTGIASSPCLSLASPMMSSSPRLLWRKRSVHEALGGGIAADVMLWRRRDVTVGILLGTLAAWIVFEKSGYTLLSLAASVMLLLVSILFVWAKAATILNRPPPPIPELHLSEEMIKEASVLIHSHVNAVLAACYEISLARDSKLFYKVAAFLWLISVIGSWTDFLTLGYTSLLVVLTVPALYEKYEESVDGYLIMSYGEAQRVYDFNTACFKKVREWILEKRKQWILEIRKLD